MFADTAEKLLMCEKADLVKCIEALKEEKECAFAEGYEDAQDEKEDEIKKLKEENEKLKKGLDKCLEVMRMTEEEMKLNKLSE